MYLDLTDDLLPEAGWKKHYMTDVCSVKGKINSSMLCLCTSPVLCSPASLKSPESFLQCSRLVFAPWGHGLSYSLCSTEPLSLSAWNSTYCKSQNLYPDLCHFVPLHEASYNKQMVHKSFLRNIKASVQTLPLSLAIKQIILVQTAQKGREGKSNSYSSSHHKNEVCLHRMKA